MTPKQAHVLAVVFSTLGVIGILAMTFKVTDIGANVLLFGSIVLFILAGTVRKLAKIDDEGLPKDPAPTPEADPDNKPTEEE